MVVDQDPSGLLLLPRQIPPPTLLRQVLMALFEPKLEEYFERPYPWPEDLGADVCFESGTMVAATFASLQPQALRVLDLSQQ